MALFDRLDPDQQLHIVISLDDPNRTDWNFCRNPVAAVCCCET
ncbi:hypothetical protein C8E89_13440 [Mycolicibacterium moriokaense]|uniref:Uncharacterized protein n=1 Tax=Mycolicibacterium moriokaense TaxID=39691 RepID=A0A318H6Y4_9MYCO|nr:hypothetical protein C8E89_13440 [Mycolicibacterium moriokaense]